jgi:hypothetical protein
MNKLTKIEKSITEEEAALFFHLLIKAFENANHQKVEYTSDALEDEQSLMINVDIDVNISRSVKSKFLNEYK